MALFLVTMFLLTKLLFKPIMQTLEKRDAAIYGSRQEVEVKEKQFKEKVVDYKQRIFYLSGPEPAVVAFKKMLVKMKVKAIKTDYFPGYVNS